MASRATDDDTAKLAAALIYIEEHRKWKQRGRTGAAPTQAGVAARLGTALDRTLSQSTVSRWLAETENRYWTQEIRGIPEAIEKSPTLVRAREIAFPANAAAQIRSAVSPDAARRLLSVHSVATPVSESPGEGAQTSGIAFAQGAMGRVLDLLSTGERWGVTWGHNVACVVGEIVRNPANRADFRRGTRVVPLCGDPFDMVPTSQSSSALAEQLDVFVSDGQGGEVLSLRNVPSFIPESSDDDFSESEIVGIRKFVLRCKAYQKIFGVDRLQHGVRTKGADPGPPIADELDGILTSVSSDERTFFYGPVTMVPLASDDNKWLNRNAFDIGGVCLARSSSDGRADALLDRLRVQWTGVTLEQLDACAERACRTRGPDAPPGVVVVAIGVQKASSVAECLRRGLINHLVCSADLTVRLETEFAKSTPSDGGRVQAGSA